MTLTHCFTKFLAITTTMFRNREKANQLLAFKISFFFLKKYKNPTNKGIKKKKKILGNSEVFGKLLTPLLYI